MTAVQKGRISVTTDEVGECMEAHRVAREGLPARLAEVLRTFGRRRKVRRALAVSSPEAREAFASMRALVDERIGRTRPVDPLTPLCVALSERAGLTATEIVRELHEAKVETSGVDAEAARTRVRNRIRRAKETTR